MSKFKIGDKVVVKYVPGYEDEEDVQYISEKYPELRFTQVIKSVSKDLVGDTPYTNYQITNSDFLFDDESLEFVQ